MVQIPDPFQNYLLRLKQWLSEGENGSSKMKGLAPCKLQTRSMRPKLRVKMSHSAMFMELDLISDNSSSQLISCQFRQFRGSERGPKAHGSLGLGRPQWLQPRNASNKPVEQRCQWRFRARASWNIGSSVYSLGRVHYRLGRNQFRTRVFQFLAWNKGRC